MEIFTEQKTYRVEYQCPECEVGKLEFTGISNPTSPPITHHKCTRCMHTEKFRGVTYPRIVTRDA